MSTRSDKVPNWDSPWVAASNKSAYSQPDWDDEIRAAVKRGYIAGWTAGAIEEDLPVEWEIENEQVDEWMGPELLGLIDRREH